MNQNTHGLKKGDQLTINIQGSPVDGMRAKYCKQCKKTGYCWVELLETRGKYERGDMVRINPSGMS
jgi:hypothetical protein